jgi:hypothetical protein
MIECVVTARIGAPIHHRNWRHVDGRLVFTTAATEGAPLRGLVGASRLPVSAKTNNRNMGDKNCSRSDHCQTLYD